jgi:hydrogenase/urease accessory protein HupE
VATTLALVLLATAGIRAHEIGTTRVAALLQDDGRYTVEIVTDAAALADKLDASVGEEPSSDTSAARISGLLARRDDVFRARVKLRFDGSEVRPDIAYSVSPPADATSPPVATIRLSGEIPSGARTFTWTYSWTFASYALLVRQHTSDNPATEWLEGGQTSTPMAVTAAPPTIDRAAIAWRYLTLGFTHIVPHGLDHMLFVLGIFLLSGRARTVLWQVSAFTVAHSITLGLSMFGILTAPPAVVEPMIALSIAYVAIENVFLHELRSWRVALVFAFGLLHGLGFAGALKELGLPRSEFLTALLTFNVGVEAGQMAVIGAAFLLVGWQCGQRDWYRRRVVVPASLLIACTAVYWTVERLPVW